MNSSLTVFVCSTFSDLSEERKGVLDAIRRLQLKHDSMEFFGARADQPIETCLTEVRRSNMLVVIVGHRYGSLVPDMGISFSEAEYREGIRLKKPCLVYIRGDDVPILPKHMERDSEKLKLLESWKSTLQEQHTVALFKEKNDLVIQVAADISRTITDLEQAEKTKKDAVAESPVHLLDELNKIVTDALSNGASEESLLSSIRKSVSLIISEIEHTKATVFLSHAASDKVLVRKFAERLKKSGIKIWLDESSFKLGSNWVHEIERGLDTADYIIFFISSRSIKSSWVEREWQLAMHRQLSSEKGPMLLPILLEPTEIPPLLRTIQYLDMTDGNINKAVKQIVKIIKIRSGNNSDD